MDAVPARTQLLQSSSLKDLISASEYREQPAWRARATGRARHMSTPYANNFRIPGPVGQPLPLLLHDHQNNNTNTSLRVLVY